MRLRDTRYASRARRSRERAALTQLRVRSAASLAVPVHKWILTCAGACENRLSECNNINARSYQMVPTHGLTSNCRSEPFDGKDEIQIQFRIWLGVVNVTNGITGATRAKRGIETIKEA